MILQFLGNISNNALKVIDLNAEVHLGETEVSILNFLSVSKNR